ncbi:MAG: TRAP transporter substrate-binding protein, partial [Terriglobales bacterium]
PLFAALLLAGAVVTTVAQGDPIIIATGASATSLQGTTLADFAKRLQEKLGKDYDVKYYADSQLGDEKELVQKLRLGTVNFTLISSYMSSITPQFGLFDMPFVIKDRQHLLAIDRDVVHPTLAPPLESKGLKLISTWENGFRQITNSVRPINVPADLAGIKLRVPPGVWRIKMFKAWDANPTPLNYGEVFVALQTKVLDGQENPLTNVWGSKFYEVQKYLSMTNHLYSPAFLLTGAASWAKLPEKVRQAVMEIAPDVQKAALAEGARLDDELLGKLKATGMTVNTADRAAFVKASGPIYEEFGKEVPGGKQLIDQALTLSK